MSTTTQINMEGNIERECSALGGLFQQIITDMKNGTPLWEDLVTKATKLHTCLRATIQAIAAYLDAFQKIADAATGARGATKEIGTALTRICLRHKAVEARMKNFTSAIMDCLVVPLQEKLEDWKKTVINLDKEHAKEYKRARSELKKRSTDTLRLQKKARKGKSGELQRRVECSLLDVNERRQILEDTEKASVRAALVEERSRFCLFVAFMKPVVDEEVAMLSELSHLQEVVDQLCKHTSDPQALPPASEQVIADLKGSDGGWSFATPPSSPSSLGSRKSSLCSISSLNSSSSGSSKSHHSPSHHYWQRSLSQQPPTAGILRISSVSSQDSGFTSQDVLFPRPPSALSAQVSNMSEHSSGSSSSTTPPAQGVGSGSGVVGGSVGALPILPAAANAATWPNLQETLQFERAASAIMSDRPHTISSAYAHGHQRPALTVYTYQSSAVSLSQPSSPVSSLALTSLAPGGTPPGSPKPGVVRPPVPSRASSLERPSVPAKTGFGLARIKHDAGKAVPKQLSKVVGVDQVQPMYVNMSELAHLAASKAAEMSFALPPPPEFAPRTPDKAEPAEKDGSTSESSLESSSGYGSQTIPVVDDATTHPDDVCTSLEAASVGKYATLPRHSEFALAGALRRRPVSTAGYPTGCAIRSTLLRRSSIQCHKPPPPIRRTSSISTSFRAHLAPVGGSMEHLPPPPAFLLEGGGAGGGGVASVADTVRTLTELNHQPASPGAARRGSRSLSAERRGPPEGLIAALSAKLSPALSPRTQRRHSEDKHNAIGRGPGPGAGFLHALNSKLAAQHVAVTQHQQQQPKANRIRQFISARIAPDPTLCHESLMDQIKRGTRLKRTRSVNDRSAPKIR